MDNEDNEFDFGLDMTEYEDGGFEQFDADPDLVNPYLADANHKAAVEHDRSDLEQVNHDDLIDNIEDDLAYSLEDAEYSLSMIDEIVNQDPVDSYNWYMEHADDARGPYGQLVDVNDKESLMELIADSYVTYVSDDLPFETQLDEIEALSNNLEILSKYNNDKYPVCKAYFKALSNYCTKYNALLDKLGVRYPSHIKIPTEKLHERRVVCGIEGEPTNAKEALRQELEGVPFSNFLDADFRARVIDFLRGEGYNMVDSEAAVEYYALQAEGEQELNS